MRYRLRYQQHDFELSEGQFVIGRGLDCQLALDDGLVSRRHAMLTVARDAVTVEDLGSRNGVLLNGVRVQGSAQLHDGDRIRIGGQEMVLLRMHQLQAPTLAQPAPTLRADAFGMLGGLADKALALGRGEEAERILSVHLQNILRDAKAGRRVAAETVKQASLYAARVGAATGSGRWINYIFELLSAIEQPCPAEVVDELYAVVRRVSGIDLALLTAYVGARKAHARGPAERFLLNRVEGLGRLVALM